MTGRHVAKVRTFCRYVLTKVALFSVFLLPLWALFCFRATYRRFSAVFSPWPRRKVGFAAKRSTVVGAKQGSLLPFCGVFPGLLSARTKKSHSGRSGIKRERSAWSETVANAQCGVGVSRLREAISQTHIPVFAVGDAHFRFEGAVPCARSCEKAAAGRVVRDADGRA